MISLLEYFNKYNKIITVFLIATVCICIFGGCRKKQENNPLTSQKNEIYRQSLFTDASHENSKVSVKYPEFTEEGMQKINGEIAAFANGLAEKLYDKDYKDLQLDIDFMVKRLDGKFLSIAFYGTGNVRTAAHPNNILVTQNFDLTGQKRVILSDIYNVDTDFMENVKQKMAEQYSADIVSQFSDEEKLLSDLQKCDTEVYECQSYLTEHGVTVCLPVPHAIGDYIEVELELYP